MGDDDRDLVFLTDCHNPVEAGALREYLEANGVFAYVQGENHSAMLGGFGSITIGLNVLVPRGQLDEARDLVAAFKNAEPVGEEDWEEDGELETEGDGELEEDDGEPPFRKSPTTAAILAVVPSLGAGHFYTGALVRGVILAKVELAGLYALSSHNLAVGIGLIASTILVDYVGGTRRARAYSGVPNLPKVRLLKNKK